MITSIEEVHRMISLLDKGAAFKWFHVGTDPKAARRRFRQQFGHLPEMTFDLPKVHGHLFSEHPTTIWAGLYLGPVLEVPNEDASDTP